MRRRFYEAYRGLTDRILTDDRVFAQLQRTLRASLDARRKVDRNLLRLFAALNLPSYDEVALVDEQVALLEEDVARLAGRLAVLRAKLERGDGDGAP